MSNWEKEREKCTRVFGTFCAYDCFNLFSLLARVEVRFDTFHDLLRPSFVCLFVVSVLSNCFLLMYSLFISVSSFLYAEREKRDHVCILK